VPNDVHKEHHKADDLKDQREEFGTLHLLTLGAGAGDARPLNASVICPKIRAIARAKAQKCAIGSAASHSAILTVAASVQFGVDIFTAELVRPIVGVPKRAQFFERQMREQGADSLVIGGPMSGPSFFLLLPPAHLGSFDHELTKALCDIGHFDRSRSVAFARSRSVESTISAAR
jgi:hypothetical protein